MKVALIVPGFSSDASDWCVPVLVDVLRELGTLAEVHVFALRYPNRRDRYRVHGAEVHSLGGGDVQGVRRSSLLASAWREILVEHRRGPFDVIHALWADEPGFVASAVGMRLRIPSLVSIMGGELVAMRDIGYGRDLSVANRIFSRLSLRACTRVTAASCGSLGRIRALRLAPNDGRLVRLPWGIDARLFEEDAPRARLAGSFRVLHVGSLVPIKDLGMLLRAVARLKEAEPGAHLHLVGEGPCRTELASQASTLGLAGSLTIHGSVPRHDLAGYYRAADVLAISSRHEMQPVTALEAGICGLSIVGTAVGLVQDLAPEAAIAVPVGDDRALAGALTSLLSAQRRRDLAAAARGRVEACYLAPATASQLLALYREVARP